MLVIVFPVLILCLDSNHSVYIMSEYYLLDLVQLSSYQNSNGTGS